MACNRDGELWTPTKFLSDDATLPAKFSWGAGSRSFSSVDYGNGWKTSDLSSLGDSVLCSAEEYDNEEGFIADLTRMVAQSTLEDDIGTRNIKGLFPSGSPKSTLCGACGCGHTSNRGNLNGVTQMKPVHAQTLDVLFQAAGKVANMRLSQQKQQIARAQYLKMQQQQQQRLNHLIHFHNSQSDVLSHHNQESSPSSPPLVWGNSVSKYEKTDPVMSSAWPTLQQAQLPRSLQGSTIPSGGSAGMCSVFLGSSDGLRRGSSGTGVFLPRQAGVAPETKKKPGCSTVLIPAKVVQALNLDLEEMNPQPRFTSPYSARHASVMDGAWGGRHGRHLIQPQQRRTLASIRSQAAVHPEISLPSEWTY